MNLLEKTLNNYALQKTGLKWIIPGGEILEYIGQQVMMIDYSRKDDSDSWVISQKACIIDSIHDFEAGTGSYELIYRTSDDGDLELGQQKICRIIPEAFTLNPAELTNWMVRFTPMSLHCKCIEREMFLGRAKNLYDTRDSIGIDELKTLAAADPEILGHHRNIQAVIDTNVPDGPQEGIVAFRIMGIKNINTLSGGWSISLVDREGQSYPFKMDKSDTKTSQIFVGNQLLGNIKILDLQG